MQNSSMSGINKVMPFPDPRSLLEQARRTDLVRFAKAHNVVEIHMDMPATEIRDILRAKGFTGSEQAPPSRTYTLFELRSLCKDGGIKWEKTDTKDILLEKLNGNQDVS